MFVERVSKPYSGWPGLDRREAPVLPAVELTQGPGLRKDSSQGHPSETGFEITSRAAVFQIRASVVVLRELHSSVEYNDVERHS